MQVKVQWIIDGIAEMEAIFDKLGARAIQGKGYLAGSGDITEEE